MNIWEYFWALVILFSVVTFTYMSVKVIIKGFDELKSMLSELNRE